MNSQGHVMMAEPSHDERAEQYFVRDLKIHLLELGAAQALRANASARTIGEDEDLPDIETHLRMDDVYRSWVAFRRLSQEMLWDSIASSVDRQLGTLEQRAHIANPIGSLTLDPAFVVPSYLAETDVHLMPGGYAADTGTGDIRQGAIMDRGGAVYLLGRNGGAMNDGRGHALVSHVFDRAADLQPRRTLEMGCGVAASAVACASYFPDAENWGIDVGASILRYAHARAEHLGVALHLAQQNAEATRFPDDHFDLVYSCAVLHETSADATRAIVTEARRILRPGGLMVHLEVPSRTEARDLWGRLQGEFEAQYNNECNWAGASTSDYATLVEAAGFQDVMVGYQSSRNPAVRGNKGFSLISSGAFACWFVVSAIK